MKLANVKTAANVALHRTGLKLKKASPEILLGVGIISIVGGTIMACKATLKAEDILDEREKKLEAIAEVAQTEEEYSQEDEKKAGLIVNVQTTVNFTKLYAPSALLISGGIACILASYGIMKKRNAALAVAYNAVNTAFANYRQRVINELGELKDAEFYTGKKAHYEEVIDGETGEVTKQIVFDEPVDEGVSPYAAFFDERSREWKKNADYNLMFLRAQQAEFNRILEENGHVFLNEVYDALDLPRTKIGALVGWVKGEGDGYIDFGLYNIDRPAVKAFIEGYERSVLLDFNVSGYVYNRI